MRVATFNILNGRSPADDTVDLDTFKDAVASLDADVSAAHVDAALQALREEPGVRQSLQQLIEEREAQFARMDDLIDKMFGELILREPNLLLER